MQKRYQKAIALLTVLLLLLCGGAPSFALGNVETRTVRVGFYHIEGYQVMDEKGVRSGYGYEVLQAMKLYNNWIYEYVGYDKGWADMQQMLLDGEIDMVISAVKTPEREKLYDFSELSVSQSGACLMVKAGESPYVAGQYDGYNGMRIGFIENASQVAKTEAFAKEKGFVYTPVYYKTSNELEKAIQSGAEVDAIVTSNMRIIEGTRRLELFAMQDVHAMVKKGNTALLNEIDYALKQISLYSPGLYESLLNKYYSIDAGGAVFFSPEEREFIEACLASGEPLRIALMPNTSPYAYYIGDMPAGILYDISAEILRRTGLKTELVVTKTDEAYRKLGADGGADVYLTARFDYNNAETRAYTLTDPYYTTDISRVTRKGSTGDIKSIAVVQNSAIETDYLPTIVTNEQINRYASLRECVNAVRDGACDAAYMYTRTAQEAVITDVTNRLTSVIMPGFTVGFSIGVREDADARLASILEKACTSLNEDEIAQFVLRYTDYPEQQFSLRGLLYNNPLFIVIMVALLLVLIFAGVMLVFLTRQRASEREKNAQLQTALDTAERANAAKGSFMSRMSHEIRTPLNAVIGYNTIARSEIAEAKDEVARRNADMKVLDCLTKSEMASRHLLTVINDVLDMSAIESGKINVAHDRFDFKELITTLTAIFYSQAKSKGVNFEVIFETFTEEWFVGDSMRLNQVLTNILSNAIKFTSAGGSVKLIIHQPEVEHEDAHIRFEVRDTGIGMRKEYLAHIWDPFEQADSSTSRRFGGTGLGMTITKSLVELMGGTIDVESELGVGTVFRVNLTLGRTEQPGRDRIYNFAHIRALVVDDDNSTCDYVRLLFTRFGVRCDTVTTGAEAVEVCEKAIEANDPYTFCIVDWQMPGMDGVETVHRIRDVAGDKIPITIITAYDFSDIARNAKEAGVSMFLSKPLFQSTLFDLLADISGKNVPAQISSTPKYDFSGSRILLAEDNVMNMEIANSILAYANLTVDDAKNGADALKLWRDAPAGTYKAILMDVQMPEMDGYEATRAIRSSDHPEAKTIPIIAMTADAFAENVAAAMQAGMNAHIAKPIDSQRLFATLAKFIPPAGE